jgi:hypothetical protein
MKGKYHVSSKETPLIATQYDSVQESYEKLKE